MRLSARSKACSKRALAVHRGEAQVVLRRVREKASWSTHSRKVMGMTRESVSLMSSRLLAVRNPSGRLHTQAMAGYWRRNKDTVKIPSTRSGPIWQACGKNPENAFCPGSV